MSLSEYELKWISDVCDKPVDDAALQKAAQAQAAREQYLQTNVSDMLGAKRQQIEEAQGLVLQNKSETQGMERVWRKALGQDTAKITEMPWRAKDDDLGRGWQTRMDVEVDTRDDVGADTLEVPPAQVEALNDALATILQSQQQMLIAFDDDGNRLFSDDDIRRELWTPLVRSGLIPENMVPDKFSEEAQAFKGANAVYTDKLKDYSKKSTGKEDILKGLSIAKDVVSLAGTIATSSITMHNAAQIAQNTEYIRTNSFPGSDTMNAGQVKEHIAALKIENAELANQAALATFASTVAVGGLEITTAAVEATTKKTDEGRWASLVDKTLQAMQGMIAKGVGSLNPDTSAAGTNHANMIGGALQAAITGVRFGPTLFLLATQTDADKRNKIIAELVGKVADAANFAIGSYAAQLKNTDPDASAALIKVGSIVQESIRKAGNAPLIYEALKNGHAIEAATLLGGGAIQALLTGSAQSIYDGVHQDVTASQGRESSFVQSQFQETTGTAPSDRAAQERAQELASAKMIGELDKAVASMDKTLMAKIAKAPLPKLSKTDIESFQKNIAAKLDAQEAEKAKAALKAHFKDDDTIKEMFKGFDEKLVGYDDLYANANPNAELDGMPPDEAEKALESIDRAILRTAELRARVEILNAITGATAGIVASFVPGAGAVVAAQKMAFDVYALVKAVEMHNKWCDSMEVAFRAGSAYGPAVERTLMGARITLSRESVKLVLDTLQLGTQIGRCFDPTGGATIASTALTMTSALVEFGYKMATEAEIHFAWEAYKDAVDNPGSRKRARKALRLNSTLAKCAIAYGACMADDPAAKEAIRLSGLSPDMLADDKDVCKRLVAYLENELNQDPLVLHVQKSARPWMPAERPLLTPASWFAYKGAATRLASPPLAAASASTPAIDRALSALAAAECWNGRMSYAEARAALLEADPADAQGKVRALAGRTQPLLDSLDSALAAYKPMSATPEGKPGAGHKDMDNIAKTLRSLVKLNLSAVKKDLAPAPMAG